MSLAGSTTTAVVLYPSLLHGHIVSMIEFGKLLLRRDPGLDVTVLLSTKDTVTVDSVPGFTFLRLPVNTEGEMAPISTPFDLAEQSTGPLRRTLELLSETTTVSALIIDVLNDAAFPVAGSLGIPTFYYVTTGAIMLGLFLYLPTLNETFVADFKDLKDEIIKVPGLLPFPAPDMPNGLLKRNREDYSKVLKAVGNVVVSSGIIINTSESLERGAIVAVRDGLCSPGQKPPQVFPIGPLVETRDECSKVGDRHECLVWLDRHPRKSVVYLCFGSVGVFPVIQLKEIANGLENSGIRFLWVVRPSSSLADSKLDDLLPEGFIERTRDRGIVMKPWVPQIDVLNHGSVGGFVTHCGWNSLIEAMRAGVPMMAWPLYAEQKINRVFLVEDIGVAVTVDMREEDGLVTAEEVERRVTELVDSEKRKVIGERLARVRDGIEKDLSPGGSSSVSLADLIQLIKRE